MTEEDAEQQLEKVIVIFRFLADKDIFESFYRSYLAKRLLGGKSASDEIEKIMIAKLKGECGQQFTSKMEVYTFIYLLLQLVILPLTHPLTHPPISFHTLSRPLCPLSPTLQHPFCHTISYTPSLTISAGHVFGHEAVLTPSHPPCSHLPPPTLYLQGMFLDMKLSKEIMEDFKESSFFTALPIEVLVMMSYPILL